MTAKDDFLFIKAYLRLRYAPGTLGLGLPPTLVVSDGMATFNKRGHPDHYSILKAAGGKIKDYSDIWEFPGQDPEWIREVIDRYCWNGAAPFRYWPMTLSAAISAVADDQRKTYPAMTDAEAIGVIVKTMDPKEACERGDTADAGSSGTAGAYRVLLSALEDERRALLSRQEALVRGGPGDCDEKAADEDKDH